MKLFGKVALGLILTVVWMLPASAQEKKVEKKAEAKKEAAKKEAPKKEKVCCPVTKEEIPDVSKASSSEYKGKKVYFCCKDCKPKFDKEPAKYMTEEKKSGEKKGGEKKGEDKGEKKGAEKKAGRK